MNPRTLLFSDEMEKLRYKKLWIALGCLWVGLVIILSLTPAPPQPFGFPGEDKVGHVVAYGFLMTWFALIYEPGRAYLYLGLGFALMGIILECTQEALGYRTFQWGDAAANAVGVVAGWLLSKTPLSTALLRMEGRLLQSRHNQ